MRCASAVGVAVPVDALRGGDAGVDGQDEARRPHRSGRRADDASEDVLEGLAGHEVADGDLERVEARLQDLHLHLELLGSTGRLVGRLPGHPEATLRRPEALARLLDDDGRGIAEEQGVTASRPSAYRQ